MSNSPRSRLVASVALGAVLLGAAGAAWMFRDRLGGSVPGTPDAPDAPADAGPAYVGAEACKGCHEVAYKEWKASPHAQNMARPTPEIVVGDFTRNNEHTFAGTRAKMRQEGARYFMDYTGPDGKTEALSIDWTMGITRHQVYLHDFPDGRIQVLPMYWNIEQQTWQDTREGPVSDTPSPIPRTFPDFWRNYGRNFNRTCMECHSSRPFKEFDLATNEYHSEFVPEIDCEACHGPAGKHARAWQAADQGSPPADREIERLGLLSEVESIQRCSVCHARKRVYQEGYKPGDVYADFFAPDLWERGAFWVDGRASNLSYHYVDYMMSACYRSSSQNLACAGACHAPHSLAKTHKPSVADSNAMCTRCHVKFSAALTQHTFHKPESDGSRCVECHMPKVDLKLQMTSRDHSIGVPLPELTASDGVPNACGNCHAEDAATWAQKWVLQWWGELPTFRAYRERVLARADMLRKVYAGQGQVEPLARLLDNPAASLVERASAAQFLGGAPTGDPANARRALEVLARHIADPEPIVRYFVADALGALPFRDARETLRKMLGDTARTVRVRAYEALLLREPQIAESGEPLAARARAEHRERLDEVRVDDPRALAPLALVAYEQGHFGEAERLLRQTVAISGDVPGFRSDFIQFLVERGRLDEAEQEAIKLAELDPEGMAAPFTRGLILLTRGRPADAVPFLERAVKLAETPTPPMVLQALEAARMQAGARP